MQDHPQSLQEQAEAILGECRMVLPGIEALLGFQLIAVFNAGFHEHLGRPERWAHGAAVLLVMIAIVLTMTPAAYQRLADPHRITEHFVTLSSRFVTSGMVALLLGMTVDVYLVSRVITESVTIAAAAAGTIAGLGALMWLAFPLWRRAQHAPSRRR